MTWDPDIYLKFGSERTRPALELLARVPIATPERVIDLGCGPGNSTALLAARWPDARRPERGEPVGQEGRGEDPQQEEAVATADRARAQARQSDSIRALAVS